MNRYPNSIGVLVPEVLLPRKDADFYKWAIVACDQFTSQPAYWEEAASIAGEAPTTLNLILPEAYLGKPGEAERIQAVKQSMRDYLDRGVFEQKQPGFVFIRRSAEGKERLGLVMALDLEHYDYSKGATTLIRATEGTIVDRIPPRLRIREGAAIELPHILVLIDDPARTVIEPLADRLSDMEELYDTDLMLGGGHITGHLVSKPELIEQVLHALTALTDADAFAKKYGENAAPLLFAMGDGNHSFATAKAAWEAIKPTLSAQEREDHPARFALVEIENVHDDGIVFEPIHRVVFGVEPEAALDALKAQFAALNGSVERITCDNRSQLDTLLAAATDGAHLLPYFHGGACGLFRISSPAQQLSVGTLQTAIDAMLPAFPGSEVDYIHGEEVVLELSAKADAIGFLLPGMKKSELFPTVVFDGALPRKTFSMGEANEKRYYLECRKILP